MSDGPSFLGLFTMKASEKKTKTKTTTTVDERYAGSKLFPFGSLKRKRVAGADPWNKKELGLEYCKTPPYPNLLEHVRCGAKYEIPLDVFKREVSETDRTLLRSEYTLVSKNERASRAKSTAKKRGKEAEGPRELHGYEEDPQRPYDGRFLGPV